MDASILRFSLILVSLFISTGASFPTRNFIVTAPTLEIARKVGEAAEVYRRDLAIFWLGKTLPNWSRPCTLRVRPGSLGAGGETKFQFVGGEVVNWNMYVQGSLERILDSVLPHEVNHTIFACHFRRPLPRWADEGAATLFEHRSEQVKQLGLLNQVIKNDRELISLRKLLTMKEYPEGYRPMLILYAEGYALVDFLVQQGGQRKYLKFLADGERSGWTQAIKANYHHGGVDALQKNWQSWVLAGMPKLAETNEEMLAVRMQGSQGTQDSAVIGQGASRPAMQEPEESNPTVRLQSPDTNAAATLRNSKVRRKKSPAAFAQNDTGPRQPAATPNRVAGRQESSRQGTAASQRAASVPLPKRSHRDATFEAPAPRPQTNPGVRSASSVLRSGLPGRNQATPIHESKVTSESPQTSRTGLESTGLTHQPDDAQSQQRKHFPQERKAVTGSIPQWAGFPGQSELF